jgi:Flp pilus assembly protein TadD
MATISDALTVAREYQLAGRLGFALLQQGKLDDAVASLKRAVALNLEYAEAHHNLEFAFQKQGKTDQAIASFYQALKLKPAMAEPLCC